MIFLLLLLAFALSSAKPIQDIQHTIQDASQKRDGLRQTVDDPLIAESFDNESNVFNNLVRMVPPSQGSFQSSAQSVQDIYNDPDAVAESVAEIPHGSNQLALPSTRSFALQKGKVYGVRNTIAVSLRLLDNQLPPPTKALQPMPKALHRRETPSEDHSSLRKRSPPVPNSPARLSMTKFRTFAATIPTAVVAARLEDFYNIIALKIETGQFALWAPARMRVLLLWDFELTFSCDKMDVPWSFIQAFVVDMAAMSSMKFTGFYEATIRGEGPLTGLVFLVKMGLRDPPPKG